MRRWFAIAALISAAPAAAGPLADALGRHGDAEVATLRARRDEPARCTLGAIYARRNDLPRAALYLAGCEHAALPDEVSAAVIKAAREVKRRLDQSPLAKLEILSRPEGLAASIDALPDEALTTPATVWVAAGPHTIRVAAVERTIVAVARKDALVMIETGTPATAPPRTQTIDLGQDDASGSLGEEHTAPPPDLKHPSLIKGKYAGDAGPAAEGPIDDPLAVHAHAARTSGRAIGLRVGAGVFDDAAGGARAGLSVALAGRVPLSPALFVALRADWSRRGGAAMSSDPVDVLGAAAGLGYTLLDGQALSIAAIGQLRGDVRLADSRGDQPVSRAGLGLAAGLELALPNTPLTAGVRFEQSLTTLVPHARDRAALFELGIDLR